MRTFRYVVLLALAAAIAGTSALAAPHAKAPLKKFPITGTYSGTASTKVDGNVVNISASGAGTLAFLGAGKIQGAGTGDSSQQPCVPFAGTGTIVGTKGVISYKVLPNASGCGDEGGHVFSVKGNMQVTKVTGKLLAKAKGVLRFTGTYSRDDGTFSVKLTGTLKK